jgi:ferredoxin
MLRKIEKKKLITLLEALGKDHAVYAPIKAFAEDIVLKRWEVGDQIDLDFKNFNLPAAKEVLTPEFEDLFTYHEGKFEDCLPNPEKAVVFGVRSCDASGLALASKFYTEDLCDPHYATRLEGMLVITMACAEPPYEECFCTSLGTGPYLEDGFDVQLYPLGDEFLAQSGSEAGKKFINAHSEFIDAGKVESELKELQSNSTKAVPIQFDKEKTLNNFSSDMEDNLWQNWGDRCIACGSCTAVCPTCTCFNVNEIHDPKDGKVTRYRQWDSCLLGGFTREASGHNPRSTDGARYQRRQEHKFRWDVIRYGRPTCTGCGRCSLYCPTRLGALDFCKALND